MKSRACIRILKATKRIPFDEGLPPGAGVEMRCVRSAWKNISSSILLVSMREGSLRIGWFQVFFFQMFGPGVPSLGILVSLSVPEPVEFFGFGKVFGFETFCGARTTPGDAHGLRTGLAMHLRSGFCIAEKAPPGDAFALR